MEIRDLKRFRAVVEAGGVTAAAALLAVTPGALSKALERLESDLGKKLFKRSGRRLVVSDDGALLYERSHRLIQEHGQLVADLAQTTAPTSARRVATFEVFSTYFLGALLASELRDAEVTVLDAGVGDIEKAVADRTVDYGITYVPCPAAGLAFRKIARTEFGIYGAPGAFADTPFSELPFAIPATRLQLASGEHLGIDSWPYERVPRRVKYRLKILETALELARRRLCVVFIPDFIAALHNDTVARPARLLRRSNPPGMGRVFQTVHLVTRAEDRDDDDTRALAAAIARTLERATRSR